MANFSDDKPEKPNLDALRDRLGDSGTDAFGDSHKADSEHPDGSYLSQIENDYERASSIPGAGGEAPAPRKARKSDDRSESSTRGAKGSAAASSASSSSASAGTASSTTRSTTAPTTNPKSSKVGVGIGVGVLAILGIGAFALLSGGGGDDEPNADSQEVATADGAEVDELEQNEPQAAEAEAEETEPEESEGDGESTDPESLAATDDPEPEASEEEPAEPETAAANPDPNVVSMAIPMRDIVTPDREADGVLSFDFNESAGEVCYSVESDNVGTPFNTHIHAENFGVKGGVVVDMGEREPGASGCVDTDPNVIADILANPLGHYAELHDPGGEWTIRGQLVETVDNPGIINVAVPMTDPNGVAPDASGELTFDFNTITGEVCFAVDAENIGAPFNTHIHDGPRGEKSGVVLDMGPNESGNAGCVDNLPVDTAAILANPAGHYAELHDPGGEWTIRGQLSDADVAGADREGGVVDTRGDGARIVLRDGSAILEGPVPDEATGEELRASLADLDAPVVDNLQVVDGAARPTGRVVFGDGVFFDSGSDQVKDIDAATLNLIVGLADSRPDWVLTVVGHTDSDGDEAANLELSLRRATAVRDLLAGEGLADDNLRIRGAGETQPVEDNNTDDGKAANRRIEFEFTPA